MDKKSQKIAVIGSGIAGMGIAHILAPHHDVTIYERNSYIGGHSRTVYPALQEESGPVDTGFVVFNYRTYPLLSRLFAHLDVPVRESQMSFGVTINNGALEYNFKNPYRLLLSALSTHKHRLLHPKFARSIADFRRFVKYFPDYLDSDPAFTLGQYLDELKIGDWLRNYFLLPAGAAIWSMPTEDMLSFPACSFLRFFHNHNLFAFSGPKKWYTVQGGSCEYVRRLTSGFADNIQLNASVQKVVRRPMGEGVDLYTGNGQKTHYDGVVFACDAPQALALIDTPNENEKEILGSFRIKRNHMYLHSDIRLMPRKKYNWANWVYLSDTDTGIQNNISVSYWMNSLQSLPYKTPLIVSMNPMHIPKEEHIYDEWEFTHPIFDSQSLRAQKRIDAIQGADRLWFCGAYQRYGFHEDGLWSAVRCAEKMEIAPPWI